MRGRERQGGREGERGKEIEKERKREREKERENKESFSHHDTMKNTKEMYKSELCVLIIWNRQFISWLFINALSMFFFATGTLSTGLSINIL